VICVLGLKGLDCFVERFSTPAQGLILHFGEAPGGALNVARLQRRSYPLPVYHAADA
jgi:hypothetical protein